MSWGNSRHQDSISKALRTARVLIQETEENKKINSEIRIERAQR